MRRRRVSARLAFGESDEIGGHEFVPLDAGEASSMPPFCMTNTVPRLVMRAVKNAMESRSTHS